MKSLCPKRWQKTCVLGPSDSSLYRVEALSDFLFPHLINQTLLLSFHVINVANKSLSNVHRYNVRSNRHYQTNIIKLPSLSLKVEANNTAKGKKCHLPYHKEKWGSNQTNYSKGSNQQCNITVAENYGMDANPSCKAGRGRHIFKQERKEKKYICKEIAKEEPTTYNSISRSRLLYIAKVGKEGEMCKMKIYY